MIRPVLALLLAICAAAPAAAASPGLLVKVGESWIFAIKRGQPANARKVVPAAKPGKGEVIVRVSAMMGTTMTISSNNPVAYRFKALLVAKDGASAVRACTLPANGRMALENWPKPALAVRISDFKPATADGSCP